jgi:anti-anti-sigma factor
MRSAPSLSDTDSAVPFQVEIATPRAGVIHAVLSGDLDYLNVPRLNDALKTILAKPELRELILDLSGITYLSGAGLGAMVALRHSLREKDAELFLSGCRGQVLRILQVTRLVFFFQMLSEDSSLS